MTTSRSTDVWPHQVGLDLEMRPMTDGDRNLVLNSWVRSYAQRSADARDYVGPALNRFAEDYVHVVRALIDRSVVVMACLKGTPDAVVGWMAWEGDVLHYALVKPRWRHLGVAKWMLDGFADVPVSYSHRTSLSAKCPVPKAWAYRRWMVWPKGEAA